MKKKLAMIVTTMLVVGSLAGCGSTAATAPAETPAQTEAAASEAPAETPAAETPAEAAGDFDAATEITVVSREDGSGTRGAFVELTGVEEKNDAGEKIDNTTVEAVISNSTEIMMTTVAGDAYGIGYTSMGALNDTVKAVKVDGAEATAENVVAGTYTLSRPFNIVTGDSLSDAAKDFMNFIMSEEGQKVISDKGYIEVENTGAFEPADVSGDIVVAGSSSVTPAMEKLIEAYNAINANVNIELQESDSTTGVNAAIEGTCDIGMASRDLKDTETGVTATAIAMDGIAVIVNTANPVEDLTTDQIKSIFTGETLTWDEVQ
ncbi:MAG: substrate-binding domain-containing protein [Lachnospiraceae bacterium]|nr:substrate-binding domain-containing protein [Lachnospiraceae bacterium]